MNNHERVIIVGGGWAGMAAALELQRHHIPVTLLESARQTGGRARSVYISGQTFDNGQHLLIGAYSETLRLLAMMGVSESDVLSRRPLQLDVRDEQRDLHIKAPALPAPLLLLWGLMTARGLERAEKYLAVRMSLLLRLRRFRLEHDMSVAELLQQYRQGKDIVRRFWEPLCLATLNTPMHGASARVFLRVLQDSFSRRRHDADLLIPSVPLGELFCESAARYLAGNKQNRISVRNKVTALQLNQDKSIDVHTQAEHLPAKDVIIATGPSAAIHLLEPITPLQPLTNTIARLGAQPIITLYLHYPSAPAMNTPMLGMSGTTAQWLFDRTLCGQPGWYAVIVSAEGEHSQWDNERLGNHIQQELAKTLPGWPPTASSCKIIREKRATFECRVDIDRLRPNNRTELPGLWLAGDYTDTGYPGTLEGAVRSGVQCAQQIIADRQP